MIRSSKRSRWTGSISSEDEAGSDRSRPESNAGFAAGRHCDGEKYHTTGPVLNADVSTSSNRTAQKAENNVLWAYK
ncbi:hypothetical protein GWI33_014561 [Rhynchophorus ferrugineus]|uniref:Uncharacterized protein n=1 Tax=Rhynchophorus ferrugineus TaxID=354439 RepID=A0A834I6W5_RHYFE|nr:hypothetical protein GWI33_014561 [Rhynchophorus ferrugineus]